MQRIVGRSNSVIYLVPGSRFPPRRRVGKRSTRREHTGNPAFTFRARNFSSGIALTSDKRRACRGNPIFYNLQCIMYLQLPLKKHFHPSPISQDSRLFHARHPISSHTHASTPGHTEEQYKNCKIYNRNSRGRTFPSQRSREYPLGLCGSTSRITKLA